MKRLVILGFGLLLGAFSAGCCCSPCGGLSGCGYGGGYGGGCGPGGCAVPGSVPAGAYYSPCGGACAY